MGLGVGAAGRTGGVLWLAVTPCFLGLLLVEAQTTTSGSEDAGVLLEARAAADKSACTGGPYTGGSSAPCPLDSWTAATEPCGDGHDDSESGWVGVICDARGGRVVYVYLWHTGVGGELLPFFGRLGALLILVLQYNPALRGDVADLAGATELRHLNLWDCPLVVGEAAALAALVHLGEEYTIGEDTSTGRLYLAGSGVHGPVAALRALPGLGAHWGMEDSSDPDLDGFSKCSAFAGCGAAGLAPVDVSSSIRFLSFFLTLQRGFGTGGGGCGGGRRVRLLRRQPTGARGGHGSLRVSEPHGAVGHRILRHRLRRHLVQPMQQRLRLGNLDGDRRPERPWRSLPVCAIVSGGRGRLPSGH
eukprot:COSAG04_NODE_141_length_23595_cov_4.393003_2_plen_360_part_00